MRARQITATIIALIVCLSGCSSNPSIENQAYVLVLGVDVTDDKMIELTIQIPKIGSSDNNSGGDQQGKDASYLLVSAQGDTYQNALETLKWSATRELNLSQIKMIVVSEQLAESGDFDKILSTIAETYHLYTAARLVVCQGNAKEFINGHETVLGSRLSDELDAMFDHYSKLGYIPPGNFAEFYYTLHSFYSDPMTIWGFSSDKNETKDTPALAMISSENELIRMTNTPSSRHYLGAVVFKEGVMSCKLNAEETLIVNLVAGNIESFNYDCNGQTYQFTPLERPRINVSWDEDVPEITIRLRLSAIVQNSLMEVENAGPVIEKAIVGVVKKCQALGIEPFGFANIAASKHLTIKDWLESDWKNMYSSSEISATVKVLRADS